MKSVKDKIYTDHCKYTECIIDQQIISETGQRIYNDLVRNLYGPVWDQIWDEIRNTILITIRQL